MVQHVEQRAQSFFDMLPAKEGRVLLTFASQWHFDQSAFLMGFAQPLSAKHFRVEIPASALLVQEAHLKGKVFLSASGYDLDLQAEAVVTVHHGPIPSSVFLEGVIVKWHCNNLLESSLKLMT